VAIEGTKRDRGVSREISAYSAEFRKISNAAALSSCSTEASFVGHFTKKFLKDHLRRNSDDLKSAWQCPFQGFGDSPTDTGR
jgi:hypothetical protein